MPSNEILAELFEVICLDAKDVEGFKKWGELWGRIFNGTAAFEFEILALEPDPPAEELDDLGAFAFADVEEAHG